MGKKKGKKKDKADQREQFRAEFAALGEQIMPAVNPADVAPRAEPPPLGSSQPVSTGPMKRREYEEHLKGLHVELVKLQEWVKATGAKICILFEGRDGAGKGGTIKAITDRVSPRVFRVVALPAPSDRERSQMYLQRYIPHLPAAGEVVIFDRSWYNRAGVERVMGFCTEDQVRDFLVGTPLIERAIIHSGVLLRKYWLEVSPDIQTERLRDRIEDGRKIWKLSPMDVQSYTRWHDYTRARDDMFRATDTEFAPWNVVKSDDKRRTRLNLIAHLLRSIPYEDIKREKVTLPDRGISTEEAQGGYPMRYIEQRF
jgi:polyphosphate kinase 2